LWSNGMAGSVVGDTMGKTDQPCKLGVLPPTVPVLMGERIRNLYLPLTCLEWCAIPFMVVCKY